MLNIKELIENHNFEQDRYLCIDINTYLELKIQRTEFNSLIPKYYVWLLFKENNCIKENNCNFKESYEDLNTLNQIFSVSGEKLKSFYYYKMMIEDIYDFYNLLNRILNIKAFI